MTTAKMETKQSLIQPKLKTNHHLLLEHIFPLMLASLRSTTHNNHQLNNKKKQKINNNNYNNNNSQMKLQLRLLNQLHLSLLSPNPNTNPNYSRFTLPTAIVALLPALLTSKYPEVGCNGAKFVGVASLHSLEMNQQIANDEETVKSLISGLACWKMRKILLATSNAVLDLATTSFGRQSLLNCAALNCIIASFLQVPKSSVPLEVAIFTEDNRSEIRYRIGFKEDETFVLLIDAAITLINTCHIGQLESIPKDLLNPFWAYMKILWKTTRTQILFGNSIIFNRQKLFCPSNITTDNLAESIFRLSINADKMTPSVSLDVVKRSIFGPDQSSLENFILNQWEDSPLLMRGSLKASGDRNNVLNSSRECLSFNNEGPLNISAILKNLISCPPIASDELVILNFLNELRGHLGSPMIYQQDMRVLRVLSTPHVNGETHFFKGSRVLHMDDILRCEEAFKEGHTIALRGMEFRFETIADIVDGLANLFGQPSAGANMYLTPANSQGLARHYDDHCVFVCQLIGAKKWKVFPRLSLLLPRLYEPVDSLDEADRVSDECNEFLLREGDILYIPRGFPHEASTILENEKPEEEVEFSLHLTLAIEVEAPFEWEGFAHIALYDWFQNRRQCFNPSQSFISHGMNVISIDLLHVAIKLIGDKDPTFRKACLVGAISLLSDGKDRLYRNQKTIFSHLINTIDVKSSFSDALEIVTLSLRKNEDPFRKLRWLQNLEDDHEIFVLQNWMIPPSEREKSFVFICNELKEKAEPSFMFVKSKFCNEVDFEENEKCYSGLLDKYRKVRKQYIDGMLSLHCN